MNKKNTLLLTLMAGMLAGLLDGCGTVSGSTTPVISQTAVGDKVVIGQEALNSAESAIIHAKASIDLDIYEFTNQTILKDLIQAHKRGIKERIILDPSSASAISSLEKNGIAVHVQKVAGGIDHVKYLGIDNKTALIGSVNFGSGSGKNEDASVWLPKDGQMQVFFNESWNGQKPSLNGQLLYTGGNIQSEAVRLIDEAKSSVEVGMFAWTDTKTQYAVIGAVKRGVKVTVYIDGHQWENKSTIRRLESGGVHVVEANTYQWLHLKVLVVDGQDVLMGSCNWSYHGFHVNDELDFEVHSPSVANSIDQLLAQTK